jgi:hypothetical protein
VALSARPRAPLRPGVELGDAGGLVPVDGDGPADGDPVVCVLPPDVAVDEGFAVWLPHGVGVATLLAME